MLPLKHTWRGRKAPKTTHLNLISGQSSLKSLKSIFISYWLLQWLTTQSQSIVWATPILAWRLWSGDVRWFPHVSRPSGSPHRLGWQGATSSALHAVHVGISITRRAGLPAAKNLGLQEIAWRGLWLQLSTQNLEKNVSNLRTVGITSPEFPSAKWRLIWTKVCGFLQIPWHPLMVFSCFVHVSSLSS